MKKHITAFYLETLLLAAAFVGVILVLTGVFGQARAQSAQAVRLTRAVALAENAAEAVAASDSEETLRSLLAGEGDVTWSPGSVVLTDGDYVVDITWSPEGAVAGGHIAVAFRGQEIYALDTAVCTGEAGT